MVESAFEFANICRDSDYHNFLFSMKASNPLVMVQAYRLLAEEMYLHGWDYPLHLGCAPPGSCRPVQQAALCGRQASTLDGSRLPRQQGCKPPLRGRVQTLSLRAG